MAKIRFLGHSSFYLEGEGLKALIDPFLDGNPAASAKQEEFNDINAIFLTHGHGDHMGSTVEIAKRNDAVVFTCNELAGYLSSKGIKTEGMHIGGRATFSFGKVKLTPAWHGCPIVDGSEVRYGGVACGFVIEVDGKKIYHSGDTGLTMEMSLLEDENIDVALLPIGGYYTMDIEDAARAVKMIRPRVAIPMHYNTFPRIEADPEVFASLVGEMFTAVKILSPGEEYEF